MTYSKERAASISKSDIKYIPALLTDHAGNDGPAEIEIAVDVDIHHLEPLFPAQIPE